MKKTSGGRGVVEGLLHQRGFLQWENSSVPVINNNSYLLVFEHNRIVLPAKEYDADHVILLDFIANNILRPA